MIDKNPRKIIIIEACNFQNVPTGGQLTFAKQLVKAFGDQIILVGSTNNKKEVGKWTKISLNSLEYVFFPYIYLTNRSTKPIVPLRFQNYIALRKYKTEIMELKVKNVIIQSPEALLAIHDFGYSNICYRFAGAENPLAISRYRLARTFSFLYDKFFLPKLTHAKLVLAAANQAEIVKLTNKCNSVANSINILQFSTKVDINVFHKIDMRVARKSLNLSPTDKIIVTTGRLSKLKGWKFMIDSYQRFRLVYPETKLIFIGNGEEYNHIRTYLLQQNLDSQVYLVGQKNSDEIALYLNASDLFIMGSYKEGWSTSLLEALACGTPACVTNFSSSMEILSEGINGYVAPSHDVNAFVELMIKCLKINRNVLPKKADVDKYTIDNLKNDLLKNWHLS